MSHDTQVQPNQYIHVTKMPRLKKDSITQVMDRASVTRKPRPTSLFQILRRILARSVLGATDRGRPEAIRRPPIQRKSRTAVRAPNAPAISPGGVCVFALPPTAMSNTIIPSTILHTRVGCLSTEGCGTPPEITSPFEWRVFTTPRESLAKSNPQSQRVALSGLTNVHLGHVFKQSLPPCVRRTA